MGLVTGLLTLPLAPVRGVSWVAEQLLDAADRQAHDPAVIRAQLAALNEELEDGTVSVEEFEVEEERLLDRLHEGRQVAEGNRRRTNHG